MYFKFEHLDEPCSMNGFQPTKITNPYQKRVVDELQQKIEALRVADMTDEVQPEQTSTFVAYYDSIIDKKYKNNLGQVKMDGLTKSLV
jgi:hypothetical protein